MYEKGFTLIELLAVIVILGIIMLIATPLILNVINDARKGSFKNSAYGIIKTAENEHIKMMMENIEFEELSFIYTEGKETSSIDGRKLDFRGTKPVSGTVVINKEGKVGISIHNGKWCAEKGYEESTVELTNKSKDDCNLPAAPIEPEEAPNELTDLRDGRKYPIVKIGDQWWMAENLKYTGNGCLNNAWSSNEACLANDDEIHYQWHAAMNGSTTPGAQGICPSGWHIPSDSEWTTLTDFAGGISTAGTKLKATTAYGTDDYEFNGYLAGGRLTDSTLVYLGSVGFWWSSSMSGSTAWRRYIDLSNNAAYRDTYAQALGLSIRCIRD